MAHPGNICRPNIPHQTSAEVQQDHNAKAKAKKYLEEMKQQSVMCTTKFKAADIANKDRVNATPCPPFTPKPWPSPHDMKLVPITKSNKSSNTEMGNEFDRESFVPELSEDMVSEDGLSATESNEPTPVAKKWKGKDMGKDTGKDAGKAM